MSHSPQVVLDTNVIYSGLHSRRGASFKLLSLLGSGQFEIHLSVPLVLEYLEERADRGTREKFERVLAEVPDTEPEDHDTL